MIELKSGNGGRGRALVATMAAAFALTAGGQALSAAPAAAMNDEESQCESSLWGWVSCENDAGAGGGYEAGGDDPFDGWQVDAGGEDPFEGWELDADSSDETTSDDGEVTISDETDREVFERESDEASRDLGKALEKAKAEAQAQEEADSEVIITDETPAEAYERRRREAERDYSREMTARLKAAREKLEWRQRGHRSATQNGGRGGGRPRGLTRQSDDR